MAVPWLRLIDAVLGVSDVVRRVKGRGPAQQERRTEVGSAVPVGIETRLAGVVVAALKEAFARDYQRLEIERQQTEAARQRAERALRLELLRQAGDREIGRFRLIAGAALASWLGTLLLASQLLSSVGGRISLGAGWLLLLLSIALAFTEQSRIARALATADDRLSVASVTAGGAGGLLAPWFLVAGIAAAAVGVLIS